MRDCRALQEQRLLAELLGVLGFTVGRGMRAKEENSSTMRPMSPTWRMMVSVQVEKVSGRP
jgi:hypothetical protein